MDIHACTESLRRKVGDAGPLNATLKFDCGDDGIVYIDGRSVPNTVDNADRDADCTVAITRENLTAMLEGQLAPATAFMTGKIRVAGDMAVALKLQRIV